MIVLPLFFLSIEHEILISLFGKKNGERIGIILGYISGWGLFILWIGLWIAPQPQFSLPIYNQVLLTIPFTSNTIPLVHFAIGLPLLGFSLYYGLIGVKEVTLKVAESHKPEKIITAGIYEQMRHPQYLAAMLAHISFSFLLSGYYSLLVTPIMIMYAYIMCIIEEHQLEKEFGEEYTNYKKKTPMLIPKYLKRW